jgi:hypothetical protein
VSLGLIESEQNCGLYILDYGENAQLSSLLPRESAEAPFQKTIRISFSRAHNVRRELERDLSGKSPKLN